MSQFNPTLELLKKPVWSRADVMQWTGFGRDKAEDIIKVAKANGGAVALGSRYAKTDCVLALFGTSREEELSLLKEDGE